MIVTAWNNGAYHSSGAGYGVRIMMKDRNKYFKKEWDIVTLQLEGEHGDIKVNTRKKSFWDDGCGELISKDIGKWLKNNNRARWPKCRPSKMMMEKIGYKKFKISLPE